jgi:hypothetical protein
MHHSNSDAKQDVKCSTSQQPSKHRSFKHGKHEQLLHANCPGCSTREQLDKSAGQDAISISIRLTCQTPYMGKAAHAALLTTRIANDTSRRQIRGHSICRNIKRPESTARNVLLESSNNRTACLLRSFYILSFSTRACHLYSNLFREVTLSSRWRWMIFQARHSNRKTTRKAIP